MSEAKLYNDNIEKIASSTFENILGEKTSIITNKKVRKIFQTVQGMANAIQHQDKIPEEVFDRFAKLTPLN